MFGLFKNSIKKPTEVICYPNKRRLICWYVGNPESVNITAKGEKIVGWMNDAFEWFSKGEGESFTMGNVVLVRSQIQRMQIEDLGNLI